MDELKPCPFCGGIVTAIETYPGRGELYCGLCDLVLGGNDAKTPEELTQTWNTRINDIGKMEYGGEVKATALKLAVWFCSECGSPTYNDVMPFYCQYCGVTIAHD